MCLWEELREQESYDGDMKTTWASRRQDSLARYPVNGTLRLGVRHPVSTTGGYRKFPLPIRMMMPSVDPG